MSGETTNSARGSRGLRRALFLASAAGVLGSWLWLRWRELNARAHEHAAILPGDELIDEAILVTTHGVTLGASPERVWPWLVQMGAGRGGWYSWDFLDNGGRPSAREIVPEWQDLEVGDVVPALPGATDAFIALRIEAPRHLVLGVPVLGLSTFGSRKEAPREEAEQRAVWSHHLEALPGGRTRLVVRSRLARFLIGAYEVPPWLVRLLAPGHEIMQRKQLRELQKRVD